MRTKSLLSAFVFTLFGASAAFAQTPGQSAAGSNSYNDSVSQRCNTMTGTEKEQCLRDENSKTEGKKESPDSAGAASAARARNPNDTYSRNQSKRCNTMTGAEKDQCLRDEDSKTDSSAGSVTGSSR